VLKPSEATFQDMMDTYLTAPSYNRGDQGFLNWYFSNRTRTGVRSLPPAYNVPPKLKVRSFQTRAILERS
jgi:glycogenin glucosyltransferase